MNQEEKERIVKDAVAAMSKQISAPNFYIGGYAAKASPQMGVLYYDFALAKTRT